MDCYAKEAGVGLGNEVLVLYNCSDF